MNKISLVNRHHYNCLDKKLIETRGPIEDNFGNVYFPGKICFIFDHIFGPIIDRKVNELFLAAKIERRFLEEVKYFDNLLHDNGVIVTDCFSSSNRKVPNVNFGRIANGIQVRSRKVDSLNIIGNFLEGQ